MHFLTRNAMNGWVFKGCAVALLAALTMWTACSQAAPTQVEPLPMDTISTHADFAEKVLKAPGPVLVDFYTTWCGWCAKLKPVLESLNGEYSDRIAFYRINAEGSADTVELARTYGVDSYPRVIIFADGEVVMQIPGYVARDYLKKILDDVLADLE